jgi:hypothetical protein
MIQWVLAIQLPTRCSWSYKAFKKTHWATKARFIWSTHFLNWHTLNKAIDKIVFSSINFYHITSFNIDTTWTLVCLACNYGEIPEVIVQMGNPTFHNVESILVIKFGFTNEWLNKMVVINFYWPFIWHQIPFLIHKPAPVECSPVGMIIKLVSPVLTSWLFGVMNFVCNIHSQVFYSSYWWSTSMYSEENSSWYLMPLMLGDPTQSHDWSVSLVQK